MKLNLITFANNFVNKCIIFFDLRETLYGEVPQIAQPNACAPDRKEQFQHCASGNMQINFA